MPKSISLADQDVGMMLHLRFHNTNQSNFLLDCFVGCPAKIPAFSYASAAATGDLLPSLIKQVQSRKLLKHTSGTPSRLHGSKKDHEDDDDASVGGVQSRRVAHTTSIPIVAASYLDPRPRRVDPCGLCRLESGRFAQTGSLSTTRGVPRIWGGTR